MENSKFMHFFSLSYFKLIFLDIYPQFVFFYKIRISLYDTDLMIELKMSQIFPEKHRTIKQARAEG